MLEGKLIKHKKFLDICFYVKDESWYGCLRGEWWNQGFVTPWFIDYEVLDPIKLEDWLILEHPDYTKSFREQPWKDIIVLP